MTFRPSPAVKLGMRSSVLVIALLVVACSSGTTAPPSDGALALGTWGGENSGMIVSDTAMHLHVACTYGDVSGRIALSANGQFDVAGSYLLRAYPIAIGPTMPARFRWARGGREGDGHRDGERHRRAQVGCARTGRGDMGNGAEDGTVSDLSAADRDATSRPVGADQRGILEFGEVANWAPILAMPASRCRGEPQP